MERRTDHGELDALLERLEQEAKVIIADEVHVSGHKCLILVVIFCTVLVTHLHILTIGSQHYLSRRRISGLLSATAEAWVETVTRENCNGEHEAKFTRNFKAVVGEMSHLGAVATEMKKQHISRLAGFDESAELLLDVGSSGGGCSHAIAGVINKHHNVARIESVAVLEKRVHRLDIVHAAAQCGLSACNTILDSLNVWGARFRQHRSAARLHWKWTAKFGM